MIDGNYTGYLPRDYASFPLGSSDFTKKWDAPLLSRQEAKERSEYLIAKKLDPLSVAMKRKATPTFQNSFGFCWAHAATMALKIAFAQSGQPVPRLSATSMACIVKNFRDQGGNAFESFPHMNKVGVCTVDTWPENSRDRSLDNPAMREEAALYRATEWYELPDGSDEHKWTALCSGFAIWSGYANIGHAMCSARYVDDGKPTSWDINSWNKDASAASEWQDSWLGDRNVIWKRGGRDFSCFEQYAIRVSTAAA